MFPRELEGLAVGVRVAVAEITAWHPLEVEGVAEGEAAPSSTRHTWLGMNWMHRSPVPCRRSLQSRSIRHHRSSVVRHC